MEYKDYIRKLQFIIGVKDTLTARIVNSVKINENGEYLVNLKQDEGFFFGDDLQEKAAVYLRKTAYLKLVEAQKQLPQNYYFKIYSAFRSLEEQQRLWDENYAEMKKKFPSLDEERLIFRVKSVCADPRSGFGGHQTGGAVDVGLCDKNGVNYPMGTEYAEVNKKTKTKSKFLAPEEKFNRSILVKVMKNTGFVNYPPEWWHYCYGDRMWAAYRCKNSCPYGRGDAFCQNDC